MLPLPMIRNSKTLNPRDPESAPVYQLETAMGAGIECFPGARAVNVPRSRFFPVKTTSDLLLLRSDAIAVDEDGKVALAPEREGKTPVVDLDSKLYKLVDSLDSLGLPSLIGLDKLTLRGRFHFQDGAVLQGTLLMENDSEETKEILPGVYAGA
ncbi:UTP--glucose-1-phosphate uridylyltransferase [Akkermansia sp.]|uniref:UTP--glucose-1-phosphate uridylyltransferase n=1 Tax=Akkermansia sp. TaxID=1872421 RepID=UPI003AB31974